ncbi:non-histone chromosomal protein HMG-14-like [Mustela erminea]|uniref:non-histone chromosomal protein HMG-14-like n=1 Tax=Mustela erminea TaxID=36723 RepID=UPI001386EFC7|nr:non-histone chromosomal protein HMG-14-like [Mustela erminea]
MPREIVVPLTEIVKADQGRELQDMIDLGSPGARREAVARQPKREVHSAVEAAKEGTRRGSSRFPGPASAKVEMSQKRQQARMKLQTKKVQTKGKRGAEGKQEEVANQMTKKDLSAEDGEAKNEIPASDEAGKKEAKSG